jgi:hypothetical protein
MQKQSIPISICIPYSHNTKHDIRKETTEPLYAVHPHTYLTKEKHPLRSVEEKKQGKAKKRLVMLKQQRTAGSKRSNRTEIG